MKKLLALLLLCYAVLGSLPLTAQASFTNLPAEQDVDPLKTWKITFSQPIGNVENAVVFDSNGTLIPTTTTISGAQIKIAPPLGGYEYGETYTLLLSDLYDYKGEKIDVAKRLDFTITTMYQPKVINDVIGTNLLINGNLYRTHLKYHSFIRANAETLRGATMRGIMDDDLIETITDLHITRTTPLDFNGFNHSFENLVLAGPFRSIKNVTATELQVDQASLLENVTVKNHLDIATTALTTSMIIQSSDIYHLRNYQKDVVITTYRTTIKKTQAFTDFAFYYDGPIMNELYLYAYNFELRGRFNVVHIPFSQQPTKIKALNEANVQINYLYNKRSGPLYLENTVRINDFFMEDDEAKLLLDDLSHITMLHLPNALAIEDVVMNYPHFKGNVTDYTRFYTFDVTRFSDDFGYFNITYQTDATDYTIYYDAYTQVQNLPQLREKLPKNATRYTGARIAYEPGKQYVFYVVKDGIIVQMDRAQLNEMDYRWYDIVIGDTTLTVRFAEAIKPHQLEEVRLYRSAINHTAYTTFPNAKWEVKDGKTQVTFDAANLKPRHLYYGFNVITSNHTSGEVFMPPATFTNTALYRVLGDHYSMRLVLLTLLDGDASLSDDRDMLARYAQALQTESRVTSKAALQRLIEKQNDRK